MRVTRRDLRHSLERMGRAPVEDPSPGFAAELERRLRPEGTMTEAGDELAAARFRRSRTTWLGAVAAAVALLVVVNVPGGDDDVSVVTSDMSTTTTLAPVTTMPGIDTTMLPVPPDPRPVPTSAPGPAVAAPVPHAVVPAPTTSTTSKAAALPTTTVAPVPPPTTTTRVVTKLAMRCEPGRVDAGPVVSCSWSGIDDPSFTGWRMHRAADRATKQVVWTSADAGTRAYLDRDVVEGAIYHYVIEAVGAAGRTLAKSTVVDATCCPR